MNGENREASKFTKSQFENRAKSIDTTYNTSHKQSLGFKSPPVEKPVIAKIKQI